MREMLDNPIPNPRRTRKSRSGCLACKRRRLKCDENVPNCHRCVKIGVDCPGYTRPMKWSTKYEKQPQRPLSLEDADAVSLIWFEEEARRLSAIITSESIATKSRSVKRTSGCHSNNSGATSSPATSSEPTSETSDVIAQIPESNAASNNSHSLLEVSPQFTTALDDMDPTLGSLTVDWLSPLDCLSPSVFTPMDQSSILLKHYFSPVCRINSCFDSIDNPFRSEIPNMIVRSPLMFSCVLSMAAAHLYQHESSSSTSLTFQNEALSHLSNELATLSDKKSSPRSEVLLSSILLGVTSAWHDTSSWGLPHLYGSRPLFKAWLAANVLDDPKKMVSLNKSQTFIISSMVFWEALASFLVDQETEVLSYLDRFLFSNTLTTATPAPWTGVGTPIFICLAKVGTLMRRKRMLRNLRLFRSGDYCREKLYSELVGEARSVEQDTLKIRLPFVSLIEDIGDLHTTPDHLHRVARCYRLATLLELYRSFPDLVEDEAAPTPTEYTSHSNPEKQARVVLGLAFSILKLLEGIPVDSTTTSSHNLILLIAGGALARVGSDVLETSLTARNLNQDITRWRQFVRDRIFRLHMSVGLRPIRHVSLMLEEVWMRMDLAVESGSGTGHQGAIFSDQIHWMDIMLEKNLETILG